METTWYSDMGALIVAPFKRGIPQIVEHGSCKRDSMLQQLLHWCPSYFQIFYRLL